MASAHLLSMNYQMPSAGNPCLDPADMDNWVDFGSPVQGHANNGKMPMTSAPSAMTSPTSTAIPLDFEDQTPVAPSHDYGRHKQQTGLPSGVSLRHMNQDHTVFASFNTGLDDFAMPTFDGMGSQSGFGSMTGDLGLDSLPAFFYPNGSQSDDFIDPASTVKQEEAQQNIRYYPGVHQQNALRAQQQVQAQRQQQMLAQQEREAEQRQRRHSHIPIDAHAEETISRVVNQIRQNSMMHASMSPDHDSMLPHMMRSKKDEEDMDDDERLLNSEEGKKLSSKERRQLRNKVSARAFRSRRKEYIGQLEGEIAVKANECTELKMQNRALMEENARFRNLAEKLLSHGAFRPFLEELSRDPELAASITGVVNGPSSSQSSAAAAKDAAPYTIPSQQFAGQQNQLVGMTLIPETQLDFSTLNLGGNNWNGNMGMNFAQPQVFAVVELPEEPVDVAALSGKAEVVESLFDTCKYDLPSEIETPEASKDMPAFENKEVEISVETTDRFDEQDPSYTLYAASETPASEPTFEDAMSLISQLPVEKSAQYELVSESDAIEMPTVVERKCAQLDAVCRRLDALMASFRL